MLRARYPEEVPVFSAEHLCTDRYWKKKPDPEQDAPTSCGTKGCAMGWLAFLFHGSVSSKIISGPIERAYKKAAKALFPNIEVCEYTSVEDINDYELVTHHDRARVLNLTTAILGYTEGNPETKNVPA